MGAESASAQEFCVACTGPDATYRCQIANAGPEQTQSYTAACTGALQREGKHRACAVRGGTVLECVGPVKRVDILGKPAKQTPAGDAAPKEPYVLAEPPKPAPDPAQPPKTVEEAVRRAAKSTSDGMAKTGEAISSGARKTWTCLTSLFTGC